MSNNHYLDAEGGHDSSFLYVLRQAFHYQLFILRFTCCDSNLLKRLFKEQFKDRVYY